MLVSLDQVNTLAKSRYKNYMITIQSVNSMMIHFSKVTSSSTKNRSLK